MEQYETNYELEDTRIVRVKGNSMLPELYNGDSLIVCKSSYYSVGDILVFKYYSNTVLVHRLLITVNNHYYCKGDNTFKLECINKNNIIGKVVKKIRNNTMMDVNVIDEKFVNLSFKISRLFLRSQYDLKEVLQSEPYRIYFNEYLKENTPNSFVNQLNYPIDKNDT